MSMVLVLDLDDTIYATRDYTARVLKEVYGFEMPGYDGYITGEITGGKSDRIFNEGTFMAKTRLFPELAKNQALVQFLSAIREDGWKVVCCTHRGFHPRAQELSRAAFRRDGLKFDEEHYLKSKDIPCKLEFLDGVYGKDGYLLVDDNPSRESKDLVGKSAILIDRPWNQDYAICPTRRVKVESLLARLWTHVSLPSAGLTMTKTHRVVMWDRE